MNGKRKFYLLIAIYQVLLVFVVFFSVNGIITFTVAQTPSNLEYYQSATAGMLGLSAAIAVGAAVLGSGMAIKTVGTSAIAALTEREESFFKAFLVVALGEALAVYGLIIAILLWTKIPTP
ncbi:MAG: ATPase V [Candidatus Lokiarchaeota archaeon]|nr:ATPase V [Candidatus Lokiarchaeota archaeon]